jgi:hypothetical protein
MRPSQQKEHWYAAMMKDATQRSIRAFYEAINRDKELSIQCHCSEDVK